MRMIDGLSAGALFLSAMLVYYVKTETQEIQADTRLLTRELRVEGERVNVLRAELAHLENPERLRRLAEQYLDLKPYDGTHLLDITDLVSLRRQVLPPEEGEGTEGHFANRENSEKEEISMVVFEGELP